jgi:hypothetical protein
MNLPIFINLKKIIMKKISIVTISLAILVWSCSHKTTPAKTETATITTAVAGDAMEGKATYTAKCGRCHGLKNPANYTSTEWVPILNSMAAKAKLDDTEKANVNAYVQANAKQG